MMRHTGPAGKGRDDMHRPSRNLTFTLLCVLFMQIKGLWSANASPLSTVAKAICHKIDKMVLGFSTRSTRLASYLLFSSLRTCGRQNNLSYLILSYLSVCRARRAQDRRAEVLICVRG